MRFNDLRQTLNEHNLNKFLTILLFWNTFVIFVTSKKRKHKWRKNTNLTALVNTFFNEKCWLYSTSELSSNSLIKVAINYILSRIKSWWHDVLVWTTLKGIWLLLKNHYTLVQSLQKFIFCLSGRKKHSTLYSSWVKVKKAKLHTFHVWK